MMLLVEQWMKAYEQGEQEAMATAFAKGIDVWVASMQARPRSTADAAVTAWATARETFRDEVSDLDARLRDVFPSDAVLAEWDAEMEREQAPQQVRPVPETVMVCHKGCDKPPLWWEDV